MHTLGNTGTELQCWSPLQGVPGVKVPVHTEAPSAGQAAVWETGSEILCPCTELFCDLQITHTELLQSHAQHRIPLLSMEPKHF